MPVSSEALLTTSKPGKLMEGDTSRQMKLFGILILCSQAVLLVTFKIVCNMYTHLNEVQVYNYLLGVEAMMFLGFGYLMTFLRWYGLGAAGLTFIITAYGMELALLAEPFFEDWWQDQVQIDYYAILDANFAVAAVLISFGALIGKINPVQIWCLVTVEILCYCMNKRVLLTKWLNIKDVGGTISIHEFGAFFGLAASYVLGKPRETIREKSSTVSDVFSLIGTLVLWLYWPSFVTGVLPAYWEQGQRAAVNTILCLLGATVTTFGLSPLFNHSANFRLSPVHIQNATLAGGVCIGATANWAIGPFGAVLLGSAAGAISTFGFARVQAFMEHRFGLHDTCGVLNLHGLPSLFGGIASGIIPAWIGTSGTPKAQLGSVGITFVVSIATGTITGYILKLLSFDNHSVPMARDAAYWEVADDYGDDIDLEKPDLDEDLRSK